MSRIVFLAKKYYLGDADVKLENIDCMSSALVSPVDVASPLKDLCPIEEESLLLSLLLTLVLFKLCWPPVASNDPPSSEVSSRS